jgi:predicted dehydrogenase
MKISTLPEHYSRTSRRTAIKTGVMAGLALTTPRWLRANPGNSRITIGIIGCGGMGSGLMGNFLNNEGVRVVATCDPDGNALERAKSRVDSHYGSTDCKAYRHYGDLLGHPGLDAVVIATPDHMHARIGIDAANAKLDVYGEKPFAWGLAEGRQLVDAVTANQRVWQTGSQQRSGNEFRRFKALLGNGTIGKITRIECGTPSGMSIQNHLPDDQWAAHLGKPPAHLDWDAYLGVVRDFPYHPMIHPWNWRWHETFGGGQLLDWVGHHVDIALWAVGLDRTGPVKVEGTGKRGDHPLFNTFINYEYTGTFADGTVIEVRSDFMGTRVTGTDGWMHVDRGRLDADDREKLRNLPEDFDSRPPSHYQDFINCVRSREKPVADAESTHRCASFGQLAIAAIDSGEALHWDPAAEAVVDNATQAAHPRLGSRVGNS